MGIGDWGLGIGDWGLGQIPNPQSPIPNPHEKNKNKINFLKYIIFQINNSPKFMFIYKIILYIYIGNWLKRVYIIIMIIFYFFSKIFLLFLFLLVLFLFLWVYMSPTSILFYHILPWNCSTFFLFYLFFFFHLFSS